MCSPGCQVKAAVDVKSFFNFERTGSLCKNMKTLFSLLATLFITSLAHGKETAYVGSTPADRDVRVFLGISLTDSIDFIRWKVMINDNHYSLDCQYGISKGGTPGFINEKKVVFAGSLAKQDIYLQLKHGHNVFYLLHVNNNLLHLLDKHKNFLIGDGGYSYVLNNTLPVKSSGFSFPLKPVPPQPLMAYQGRTPCQGLSDNPACEKMKWYILLFTDPQTKKPTYFLEGGRQYKKASMSKGKWDIIEKNGRTIYRLLSEKWPNPMYLLRSTDAILFITDAEGNLLVGDKNFSYTLNRTIDQEPAN